MTEEPIQAQQHSGILFAECEAEEGAIEIIAASEVLTSRAYVCEVRIVREEEGGFSAYAPQLPGAHSQGETEQEASENIKEAVGSLIRSYLGSNEEIPWVDRSTVGPRQEGEMAKWVTIDA